MRPRRRLDLVVLMIWILFIYYLYQHRSAGSDEAREELDRALPYETEHEQLPYGYHNGEDVVGGPEVPIKVEEKKKGEDSKGKDEGGKEDPKGEEKGGGETTAEEPSMTTELLPQAESTVKNESVLDAESAADDLPQTESSLGSESSAVKSVSAPVVPSSTPMLSGRPEIGETLIIEPTPPSSASPLPTKENPPPPAQPSTSRPGRVEAIGNRSDGNTTWAAPELRDAE